MKQLLVPALVSCFVLTACPQKKASVFHGQVEFDEIDIASRLSSRVKEIKVELGDAVEPGQLLAVLDDDLIAIRNERAQATIQQAHLQKKLTDQATRNEDLAQLQAAEQLARSQREFARQSFKRAQTLYAQGAISTQQWEEVTAKEKAARSQYEMAKSRLEAGRNGARDEQKAMADASLLQAETGLAEVSAYDKDLQLAAPLAGTIHAIHARTGELVPQGYPVISLLDRNHPRLSFYVPESRLSAFQEGKFYTVTIPALSNAELKVQLARVQVMPAVLTQVVTEDRSARDIRTFELTFKPAGDTSRLQSGMSLVIVAGDGP